MTTTVNDKTSLDGKAIVLSGGTTGIGRATAKILLQAGAKVLIFGRHQEDLDEALKDLKGDTEGQVFGIIADQAKYEDVEEVFRTADHELQGVDILIANAALPASKILDSEYAEWKYVVETNLLGYMTCCRLATDRMKQKGSGHIVTIGSMSADAEDPNNVYVATKAGVRGFTKSFAPTANKLGIRVSLIEPGLVGTDMTVEKVQEQQQWQEEGKMMKAEDIAECILYVLQTPERCNVEFVQIRPKMETD